MGTPYEVIIDYDPRDGIYVARAAELEGAVGHGKTREEALERVQGGIEIWRDIAREEGWAIPAARPHPRLAPARTP